MIGTKLLTVTSRGKGGTTRAHAHRHARTLPNPEALVPEIEEGAVNQLPLQALFLLPWGGARPATGLGAISINPTDYARGLVFYEIQGRRPSPSDARLAAS